MLYASQARVESVSVLCASHARVQSVSVLCASQARVEKVAVLCASQARVWLPFACLRCQQRHATCCRLNITQQ